MEITICVWVLVSSPVGSTGVLLGFSMTHWTYNMLILILSLSMNCLYLVRYWSDLSHYICVGSVTRVLCGIEFYRDRNRQIQAEIWMNDSTTTIPHQMDMQSICYTVRAIEWFKLHLSSTSTAQVVLQTRWVTMMMMMEFGSHSWDCCSTAICAMTAPIPTSCTRDTNTHRASSTGVRQPILMEA